MKNAVVLKNEARMRLYLAATAWALCAVLGAICGLAVLLATCFRQFIEVKDRHYAAFIGAIFIALCAAAFYFAYYLFFGAP